MLAYPHSSLALVAALYHACRAKRDSGTSATVPTSYAHGIDMAPIAAETPMEAYREAILAGVCEQHDAHIEARRALIARGASHPNTIGRIITPMGDNAHCSPKRAHGSVVGPGADAYGVHESRGQGRGYIPYADYRAERKRRRAAKRAALTRSAHAVGEWEETTD